MKLSIKYKLLPVIMIGIVMISVVFFLLALDLQKQHLDRMSLDSVQTAKKTFYSLVESDDKMLKAAMTDFMTNQEFKDVYLKNDRNQLAQLGKDLYERMAVLADHLNDVGQALGKSVSAYNRAVGSLETRILPAARRFKELGVASEKEIPLLEPAELVPRKTLPFEGE